jgi:hypothetical protein
MSTSSDQLKQAKIQAPHLFCTFPLGCLRRRHHRLDLCKSHRAQQREGRTLTPLPFRGKA